MRKWTCQFKTLVFENIQGASKLLRIGGRDNFFNFRDNITFFLYFFNYILFIIEFSTNWHKNMVVFELQWILWRRWKSRNSLWVWAFGTQSFKYILEHLETCFFSIIKGQNSKNWLWINLVNFIKNKRNQCEFEKN